jgi:alpha-glucosidase
MLKHLLLGFVAPTTFALAVPTPGTPSALVTRADADPNACPGYTASNVVTTDSSLTADLTLAGPACNVYSEDLQDLKLLVEQQNGICAVSLSIACLDRINCAIHVLPSPNVPTHANR